MNPRAVVESPRMPRILATGTALPPYRLRQEDAEAWAERLGSARPALRSSLGCFRTAGVRERHFAFAPNYFADAKDPAERAADFLEQGTALAAEAARDCLQKAGVKPEQVDQLLLATSSCPGMPGPETLLARRLGLREDVRRSPLFGLGGAGGAVALARATEYLKGHPRHRALAVAVDLCDRIFQLEDPSPEDLAAAALFGDGAAAVLAVGDEVPGATGPRILGARSLLLEGPEDVGGGRFTEGGFRPAAAPGLADLLGGNFRQAVEDFLLSWAMSPGRIRHWILPPGDEEAMAACREAFGLSEASLEVTRGPLERMGDTVGAFPLIALAELHSGGRPRPGDKCLLAALGPGPTAELMLLGG